MRFFMMDKFLCFCCGVFLDALLPVTGRVSEFLFSLECVLRERDEWWIRTRYNVSLIWKKLITYLTVNLVVWQIWFGVPLVSCFVLSTYSTFLQAELVCIPFRISLYNSGNQISFVSSFIAYSLKRELTYSMLQQSLERVSLFNSILVTLIFY